MNIWKSNIVYTTSYLPFYGLHISGKRTFETLVELLKSNFLNCCLKIAFDVHKIGLKMRE